MSNDVSETGAKVRREILDDAHVDRAAAETTPFIAAFQEFITRYAWGRCGPARDLTDAPVAR
jgi:hypothetical protein